MKTSYKAILVLLLAIFSSYSCSGLASESNKLRFLEDIAGLANLNITLPKMIPVKCYWLDPISMSVFNLNNLKRQSVNETTLDNIYNHDASGRTVYFSFCEDTLMKCDNQSSQVLSADAKNENCITNAGSIENLNSWSLINKDDSSEGVKIDLNSGEVCQDQTNYTTSFIMRCNRYMEAGTYNLTKGGNFESSVCSQTLEFESMEACPKMNSYAIWNFLMQNRAIFGALLIIIGFFEVLFGSTFITVTIFIVCCVGLITIFLLLFSIVAAVFVAIKGFESWVIWVVVGVALFLGIYLGYLVSKNKEKILGFILGGYMGYIGGIILYNMFFIRIEASPTLIYWLVIIASVILGICLAQYLMAHILIIATAFCGAYALIRGISLYAGGFPNESYVMDLMVQKEWEALKEELNPFVYLYIFGFVLIFAFGVFYQYRYGKKEEDVRNQSNLIDEGVNKTNTSSVFERNIQMETKTKA